MKSYKKAIIFITYIIIWLLILFIIGVNWIIPYLNSIETPEQQELNY